MINLAVLKRLYTGDKQKAVDAVLALYDHQQYAVINYLYFAQLMHHRVSEGTPQLLQKAYRHALLQSDFLFADGIALQLFYRWTRRGALPPNLNGTDFSPRLLHEIVSKYGASQIHLGVLNVWDETIGKPKAYIDEITAYIQNTFGCPVSFVRQCHYRNRDTASPRETYEKNLYSDTRPVRVLLNFIWAPFQEVMIDQHREFISHYRLLVLNQGGTIDFRMGVEKRAPQRVIQARVLETPWRIFSNPSKNLRKVIRMFGIFRILPGLVQHMVASWRHRFFPKTQKLHRP